MHHEISREIESGCMSIKTGQYPYSTTNNQTVNIARKNKIDLPTKYHYQR
jgi:hypothetical protein